MKARPGAPTSRGGVASLAGGGVAVVVARDEVVGYHSSPSNSDGGSPRSSAAPSLGGELPITTPIMIMTNEIIVVLMFLILRLRTRMFDAKAYDTNTYHQF